MSTLKIRLKFLSPLHISARGVQFEQVSQIIHSDTLFGALVNAWSLLYPEDVPAFFTEASNGPPFLLSSAFPYFKDWEFFPRPLSLRLTAETKPEKRVASPPDLFKKFKRVQFLESRVFFDFIKAPEQLQFHPEHTLADSKFWLAQPPPDSDYFILRQEEMPRVVIDRYTNAANQYFVSELHFEDRGKDEHGGLFFLARFLQEQEIWKNKFLAALRLLGDEGLGLDRSSGKGLFEVAKADPFIIPEPETATRFATLSLFHPTDDEVKSALLDAASYELVQRSGWVTTPGRATPYRRQTLTMFAEGSVFTGSLAQRYGDMPLVLKKNPAVKNLRNDVYRYGYAFPVGIAEEKDYGQA